MHEHEFPLIREIKSQLVNKFATLRKNTQPQYSKQTPRRTNPSISWESHLPRTPSTSIPTTRHSRHSPQQQQQRKTESQTPPAARLTELGVWHSEGVAGGGGLQPGPMEHPGDVAAAEAPHCGPAVAQGDQGLAQPALQRRKRKERGGGRRRAGGGAGPAAGGPPRASGARRSRLDFLQSPREGSELVRTLVEGAD